MDPSGAILNVLELLQVLARAVVQPGGDKGIDRFLCILWKDEGGTEFIIIFEVERRRLAQMFDVVAECQARVQSITEVVNCR